MLPFRQSGSIHRHFPISFAQTPGDRRAEEGVPFLDFPNRGTHTLSRGLFKQIAHRAGVGRFFDIRFIRITLAGKLASRP
jgi:hypothetical protein